MDSNTIGHPAISPDAKIIIFSAEMDGGYGGKDLWISRYTTKDEWKEPKNLGPAINTSGDEMFPFLHSDSSLYFASDGHPGMGGLDIFKSELNFKLTGLDSSRYTKAINLKYPINSSADDFGMIVERESEQGYFSSNRLTWTGENGKHKRTNGSDNIYYFELPPLLITLQGLITDTTKGKEFVITGANVKLDEYEIIKPSKEDTSKNTRKFVQSYEIITPNTGSYYFDLSPIRTYDIIVSKTGYLTDTVFSLTTVGIKENTDLKRDINLNPLEKEIILPRIEYDYKKWELRPESEEDLDIIYDVMIKYPEIVILLNSHTDFRGEKEYNLELSDKRAKICIEYLITKGIDSNRLDYRGVGESEPYKLTSEDAKHDERGNWFTKKIFAEDDILTEDYINKLKNKYKDLAHQYNRRTTSQL